MKRIKILTAAAFVLAVGGAFASNKHILAADIYSKPGGVCTLNCSSTFNQKVCEATGPYFSTLGKCTTGTSDVTMAYKP